MDSKIIVIIMIAYLCKGAFTYHVLSRDRCTLPQPTVALAALEVQKGLAQSPDVGAGTKVGEPVHRVAKKGFQCFPVVSDVKSG